MRDMIIEGAKAMGLSLPGDAADKLMRYHAMLTEAAAQFNLTKVDPNPREAVDRNYLDALTPLAVPGLLDGARTLCDVGCGAGLPGLPLSIALPHVRVTLIDSLGKRVAFVNDVIKALQLNAECLHMRAEDAARGALRDRFDIVTARAVAALPTLIEWCMPLTRPGGCMVAWKGPSLDEELASAPAAIRTLNGGAYRVVETPIPWRDWRHRLFILEKAGPTPKGFPRKSGEAKSRPLI